MWSPAQLVSTRRSSLDRRWLLPCERSLSFGLRWLQAHGSGRRRQAGLPALAGSVPVRHGGSAGVQKRSGVRQQVLKRECLENPRPCGRRRSGCPRAAPRWSTVLTSSSASLPDFPRHGSDARRSACRPACADSVPAPTACRYRLSLATDEARESTHAACSIVCDVVFFWCALASGARERTETAGWSAGLGRFGARQTWRDQRECRREAESGSRCWSRSVWRTPGSVVGGARRRQRTTL